MQDYRKIRLVILDVDGTLTDGSIYYDAQGNELKRFDVKDGLGIRVGVAAGLEFAIITGRESPMVKRRAKELGIRHLLQGVQKKKPALLALLEQMGLTQEQVAYMGDDLNDKAAMESSGICACPTNADPQIQQLCDFISPNQGGHGAVRDFIQEILKQQGIWEQLVESIY